METPADDKTQPHKVVTRDGATHVQTAPTKERRSRRDCDRCSLDNDYEGCLQAKCRNSIYRKL